MVLAAPTIDRRLHRVINRLTRGSLSAAAIHREIGRYAVSIGLPRPSYEQTRVFVNLARRERAERRATTALLLEVDMEVRPVSDLYVLLRE